MHNYFLMITLLLVFTHPLNNGRDGSGSGSSSTIITAMALSLSSTTPITSNPNNNNNKGGGKYNKHTLAILTLPLRSTDRIANEAILETSLKHIDPNEGRLSVVLRCRDNESGSTNNMRRPAMHELRGYVGEIYSMAWDCVMGLDPTTNIDSQQEQRLIDIIIYPTGLPNIAPERWLQHRPDLDCICSHDTIIGWVSSGRGSGKGLLFSKMKDGGGNGGLVAHVNAINDDRKLRGLNFVNVLQVDKWPEVCSNANADDDSLGKDEDIEQVVFLEDEEEEIETTVTAAQNSIKNDLNGDDSDSNSNDNGLIGSLAYRIPPSSLYNSVAVGGTFDGMHYGHRKLLTLAISSVVSNPTSPGKLLIGVTSDEMLVSKEYSELIPSLKERIKDVKQFCYELAPGLKNRVRVVPIIDKYGPPGAVNNDNDVNTPFKNDFDALILSHETLSTGKELNKHRVKVLGMKPLKLLCTRRTEAHGMSSTVLRRMRKIRNDKK